MSYWKKLALVTLLGLTLGGLAATILLGAPAPARCAFCWSDTCTGPFQCGIRCVCITQGTDLSGYCYSIE